MIATDDRRSKRTIEVLSGRDACGWNTRSSVCNFDNCVMIVSIREMVENVFFGRKYAAILCVLTTAVLCLEHEH